MRPATRRQATHTLKVDETAPTIAINTIAGDDILNAVESHSALAISGTTSGVEDGQHVTVTLNGHTYDAVVASGAWTATVAAADLAHAVLPDGSYPVTANVLDAAGNPAPGDPYPEGRRDRADDRDQHHRRRRHPQCG